MITGSATAVVRKIGGVFEFQPDPSIVNGVQFNWPLIQVNVLTKRTIKVDKKNDTPMDDTNGIMVPVGLVQTAYIETWTLTTQNVNAYLLALLFGSPPPTPWTQAAATATAVPHVAFPAAPLQLVDANGVPVRMVSGTTPPTVQVGGSTAVPNLDYTFAQEDLDRGLIYTGPNSTMFTPAALAASNVSGGGIACTVSYGLAVASGLEIVPLGSPCVAVGNGAYHASSCDNAFAMPIEGRFSPSVDEPDLALDKAATISLTCVRLYSPGSTRPYGRIRMTKGAA